jgi:hypothetical protein
MDGCLGIPIEQNDKLIVHGIFTSPNTIPLVIRFCVLIDGVKMFYNSTFTAIGAVYTTQSFNFELPKGLLISTSIITQQTGRNLSTLYATISVGKWGYKANQPYINLVTGHFELGRPLIWTFAGPCQNDVIPLNNQFPANAGAVGGELTWAYAATSVVTWLSWMFTFVADANVHNRLITMQFSFSTSLLRQIECTHVITAGETHQFFLLPNVSSELVIGNNIYLPFPPFRSGGIMIWKTLTDGIQTGDQYTVNNGFAEVQFQT